MSRTNRADRASRPRRSDKVARYLDRPADAFSRVLDMDLEYAYYVTTEADDRLVAAYVPNREDRA